MGQIHLLPAEEARKIAAGEVVDRPAALVREFIDNALDAGATHIEVSLEAGGTKRVEVNDDGCGMDRDDLELACLTHATSKIQSMSDLSRIKTMGFRGEALAAAAAVSRLEILSSTHDTGSAWRLTSSPTDADGATHIEAARRVRGTTVRALGLFDTIPVRKRFLKRDSSEALLCQQMVVEKALAFPGIVFRFLQDGSLKKFFPACRGEVVYKQRFAQAILHSSGEAPFLHEITARGEGFEVVIVVGGPEIYRAHRREQFIFANGRRIAEYSLQQAFEYGTQGAFPNGCHPCGAIFIDIDPAHADFNIHPAKREAKFVSLDRIHHAVSSSLRVLFHQILISKVARPNTGYPVETKTMFETWSQNETTAAFPVHRSGGTGNSTGGAPADAARAQERQYFPAVPQENITVTPVESGVTDTARTDAPETSLRYIGPAFNLFLLVEKDGRLYAIDQHAAHERILYNKLLAGNIVRQELLVPVVFTTEDAGDDDFLEAHREQLARLGIVLSGGDGTWRIEALPALWRAGDGETVKALLDLRNAGGNIAERWAQTVACHSALRDGDILDDESALHLALQAFELPVQHCPHGRPIIAEIKKEELLRAVRRT